MTTTFHPGALFLFYSTWALVIHGMFFLFPDQLPSTWALAWIVFVGGMLGNLLYIPMYNMKGNLLRLPYELVMHILPLAAYYYTAIGRKNQVCDWRWPVALAILYSAYYGLEAIVKYYADPLHYVFY